MHAISEQIVDDAWLAVGHYSDEQAQEHMERLGSEQPQLLAFVIAAMEPLSEDAQELGVYLLVVTHKIFEKAAGGKLDSVTQDRIEAIYEHLEETAADFEDRDDDEDEPPGGLPTTQPHVMQYIVDALTEIQEDEEVEEFSDDDVGGLFIVMKTVVDALDEVAA